MATTQFRGIVGVVRRGINSDGLKGQITPDVVRHMMPVDKQHVPDRAIIASLNRMARGNEIQRVHKQFFTKDIKPRPASSLQEVIVVGKLLGADMHEGKMVARVEVTSMDYK